MSQRKFTIGIAVAAAIALPLSLTTPALADDEASTGYGIASEATVDLDAEIAAAAADAAAASEQGAALAAESAEADAAELDLDDAVAHAVTGTFSSVSVASGGSMTAPTSSSKPKKKNVKVTFNAPAANSYRYYYMTDANYAGPKIKSAKRNKGIKTSYLSKPYVDGPLTQISPAHATKATISAYKYTSPGKYKVTVPVVQRSYYPTNTVVKSDSTYVTVKANTKTSKALTGLSGSARAGKTFPLTVKAPNYQAGAKVTVYYKAPGKKKYKKVSTGKLKAKNASYSKAKINISKKYNLGGKGGRVKVKVGGVTYAGGYTSASAKLYKY